MGLEELKITNPVIVAEAGIEAKTKGGSGRGA